MKVDTQNAKSAHEKKNILSSQVSPETGKDKGATEISGLKKPVIGHPKPGGDESEKIWRSYWD